MKTSTWTLLPMAATLLVACGSAPTPADYAQQQPRLANNLRSNLIVLQPPVGHFDANLRWSSNERAGDPDLWALASSTTTQDAFAGGGKVTAERLVRCVRPLTP